MSTSFWMRGARLLKYLVSGGTAACTLLTFLYVLTEIIGLHYLLSAVIAYVAAFAISFVLQKFWTFGDARITGVHVQALSYVFVGLLNLLLNTGLLYLFVEYWGFHYLFAQIVTSGAIAVSSFFIYKHVIFSNSERARSIQNVFLSLLTFFQFHLIAIILATCAGVISGVPQQLAQTALGSQYQGVPFLYQDAELVYLTRIHELQDGYKTVYSPFLHDYKQGSNIVPPTGEYAYFVAAEVLQLPLNTIVVASKYVLPAILFLLIYAYVLLAVGGGSRLLAVAAASLIVMGYELLHPGEALAIIFGHTSSVYLSLWTRLVNPITGAILLFSYLIALRLVVAEKRIYVPVAVVLLASMIGYIFTFGIAFSIASICALILLVQRYYTNFLWMAAVPVGALLILAPHLITALGAVGGSEGLHNGLFHTHLPLLGGALFAACVATGAVVLARWWRGEAFDLREPITFSCITIVACVAAQNQQVLTGGTVWPFHFVQYATPLSCIALLIVFAQCIKFIPPFTKNVALICVIVASFGFSIFALQTYALNLNEYRIVNRYAGALAWLDTQLGSCVVLSQEESERINPFITAFTHCDVYMTTNTFTGVPQERIKHNFLVYMFMQGVTASTADTYAHAHIDKIKAVLFRDWRDLFSYSTDPWLKSISDRNEIRGWSDVTATSLATEFKTFIKGNVHDELLQYPLTYIILDKRSGTILPPRLTPLVDKAFEQDGIVVYRVR